MKTTFSEEDFVQAPEAPQRPPFDIDVADPRSGGSVRLDGHLIGTLSVINGLWVFQAADHATVPEPYEQAIKVVGQVMPHYDSDDWEIAVAAALDLAWPFTEQEETP